MHTSLMFNHSELDCQYSFHRHTVPPSIPTPERFDTPIAKLRGLSTRIDETYGKTAAAVGGATLAYGAAPWRFKREDFRMKSTYGSIPGTSLEDWPITYDDLEPYYEKAEYDWEFPDWPERSLRGTSKDRIRFLPFPSTRRAKLFATQPGDLDGTPSRLRSRS